MHLSIGIASETRAFGKAMRRTKSVSAPDRVAFARLLADEERRAFTGA